MPKNIASESHANCACGERVVAAPTIGSGRVAGYSMVQLISTSLISGHFANDTNNAYLDIFSCKGYDPAIVEAFSKDFFGARRSTATVTLRY
jgi:hypothetical protein